MEKEETLERFYKDVLGKESSYLDNDTKQFNLFSFEDCTDPLVIKYRRRDFYKITLLKGKSIIHYGDKSLEVNGTILAFFSPEIPYTIEIPDNILEGKYFIFRASYFNDHYRQDIKELPIFKPGFKPVYVLNKVQEKKIIQIFNKMQTELFSDYKFKHDLIRNHISEIIHFAQKLLPAQTFYEQIDANIRITSVFNQLLDLQFPIEPGHNRLEMRSPRDYAEKLYIHVNHLNHALKTTTGKTTTALIATRIMDEARILLKHSNYSITEISYSLGFDDPTHFGHFFKKQTGKSPSTYRL
jgi:AraC family transcriptional activator of pobA